MWNERATFHIRRFVQEAAQWHALQRQGGVSAEQQTQFMRWLVAAPEHLREDLAITRIGSELGAVMRGMSIDLDALLIDPSAPSMSDNVVALPLRRTSTPVTTTPRPGSCLRLVWARTR